MTRHEIILSPRTKLEETAAKIERCCAEAGLRCTLKGTLATHPGSVHWHFKRGAARGVVEITLDRKTRRLWLSVQDGRKGKWTTAAARRMKAALQRELR